MTATVQTFKERVFQLESQISAYRFEVAFMIGQLEGLANGIEKELLNPKGVVEQMKEFINRHNEQKGLIFANKEANK